MRAFVTGASGFLGGQVAAALRARGDEVEALVRSPGRAGSLIGMGCRLVEGDLGSVERMTAGAVGCDALVHVAADYRIGIRARDRAAMYEANVLGTERALEAGVRAGVGRIVYVSTIGVFGNTRGQIVDESYERPPGDYLSYYDETKYLAHRHALHRIAGGVPIIIVQPGGIYGPDDHSETGDQIARARAGRLPAKVFPEVGLNLARVEDVAQGVLLALDRGRPGRSYVLGGEIATLGHVIDKVSAIAGRAPPRLVVPPFLVRLAVPLGPLVGPVLGFPSNLAEVVSSSYRVTYWATDARARRELGYSPRGLDEGLRWPSPPVTGVSARRVPGGSALP